MSIDRDAASSSSDAAARRRWMIGLAITVLFGGFGAVMAWLSYANRAQPTSSSGAKPSSSRPASTPSAEPSTAPEPKDRGKGHNK